MEKVIEQKFEYWLKMCKDEAVKADLLKMKDDQTAKTNAFYKDLEFGTAGLRGVLGAGTNCLNIYNIGKVSQGIAGYMKKYSMKTLAISYDSRIMSKEFAEYAAAVYAANGIKVYISHELMPTPYLSFMVRYLKTDMGVMITASHNPAKYNGYKVYNSEGYQVTDDAANEITNFVEPIDPFSVECGDFAKLKAEGNIETVNIEQQYLDEVNKQAITPIDIDIVFTPLNGTGYRLVPMALRQNGAKNIHIVKEQAMPDGNFTTCPYPNPEKHEAMKLALEYAKDIKAPLVIGTDPDADRMGIAVLHNGEHVLLTGNEIGILLIDYIFNARKDIVKNPVVVKTIVSSALAQKIAEQYGAEVHDVLTGFKYIGEVIGKLEKKGEESRFVFGFEESYGFLAGSHVRDKDAVVASVLAAGMVTYYVKSNKSPIDRLNELYSKFGTYVHKTFSFEFEGASGAAKMGEIMKMLRQKKFDSFGGLEVVEVIDYLNQTKFDLPKANVIIFKLFDGSMIIVRPSGTEPLIKVYLTVCSTPEQNDITLKALLADLKAVLK